MEASERASIIAQTAAKVAGQIYMGTGDITGYRAAVAEIHKDLLERNSEGVEQITAQSQAEQQARQQSVAQAQQQFATQTQAVQQAFPNAQVVYQGPSAPPAGIFPPGTVTISAPEAITDEAAWADVFTNPNNWFNNTTDQERSTIFGGKGPDFRAKTDGPKDKKGQPKALWLFSQYGDAPLWVFDKLHLQPRGTVVEPAAQPFAPQLQSQVTGQNLDAPF